MTLSNIKSIKNERGFTLVELLIVIVVIAILAAITIVAYNGVQNKAHTTAANSAASTVIKKAALYQTENQAYPASLSTLQTATTTPVFTANDPAYVSATDVVALSAAPTTTTVPAKDNSVFYAPCGTTPYTGAKATYWDYSDKTAKTLTTGDCS